MSGSRERHNWDAVRSAYLDAEDGLDARGRVTLAGLSRRFGVSLTALRRRARAERWGEQRRMRWLARAREQAERRLDHEVQRAATAAKKFLGLLWAGAHGGVTCAELSRATEALGERAAAVRAEAGRLERLAGEQGAGGASWMRLALAAGGSAP